jgi:hypothetical protein
MSFDAEVTIIEEDRPRGRAWVCTAFTAGEQQRALTVDDHPCEVEDEQRCPSAPSTHRHLLLVKTYGESRREDRANWSGPLGPGLRPVARAGPT